VLWRTTVWRRVATWKPQAAAKNPEQFALL